MNNFKRIKKNTSSFAVAVLKSHTAEKAMAHRAKGIDYALNKENIGIHPQTFCGGENRTQLKNGFCRFQDLNGRANKKDLRVVLSLEPKDQSEFPMPI